MLLPRVITSLVGAPLLLGLGYVGGVPFLALVVFIVVMGILELHGLLEASAGGSHLVPPIDVSLVGGLSLLAAAYAQGVSDWVVVSTPHPFGTAGIVTLFIVLYALVRCSFDGKSDPMGRAAFGLFAALYVGGLLSTLLLLRGDNESGWAWFTLVVGTTWGLDVGAYIGGRTFGRTPLVPRLSPKKTVEGAVIGLLCAAVVALLLSLVFNRPPLVWALMGALAGIVGQAGDLVESAIKRHAGVKDSGRLLPGHGGVLDRFDGFMFIAPTLYLMVWVFGLG